MPARRALRISMARSSRSSNSQVSTMPWGEAGPPEAESADADLPAGVESDSKGDCSRFRVIHILPEAEVAITRDSEAARHIVSRFQVSQKEIFYLAGHPTCVHELFMGISRFCLDSSQASR